jgi:hypothetical protein
MKKLTFLVSLFFISFSYSQTDLSGTLSEDLTLSAANSPYQLSDHLIVSEGFTLTIEPGVTINASDTQQILIKGGAIVSEGTPESPIILNSSKGASLAIKEANLDLSSFKYTEFNGFHLFVAAGETDNQQIKCSGTLVLHDIKLNNNNLSDGSRSDNTTIDIQDTTFENVTLSRSHENNFIIIEDSKINNSNIEVSDFRMNRNNFYNSSFKSESAYRFKEAIDNKITFTGNNFYDCSIFIEKHYDQLILNRGKFINTTFSFREFWETNSVTNVVTISNSVIVDNNITNSTFFNLRGYGRVQLYNVSIVSNNDNILHLYQGHFTNIDFSNTTIQSELPDSNHYFILSHPTESNAIVSSITNSNIFLKETPAGRYLIYNNMRSGFNASSNYWGEIDTDKLSKLVYDFNDNPTASLGAVDLTSPLDAPNTSAPISSPKGFVKVVDGNDLILKWVPNIESDVAGYKIHYGSHTDYVYENTIDVGNVTTYTLTGGAALENINITAYDSNADGTDDQLEGNESWYTEANDPPTLAFETEGSSVEENQNVSVQLTLNYASPEEVVVNFTYTGTAENGIDYTAPETLTIPIGQTTATLYVETLDDSAIEILEDIQVTVSSANGVTLGDSITHTLSLVSDDYPTYSIGEVSEQIDEGESVELKVSLATPHAKDSNFRIKNSSSTVTSDEFSFAADAKITFSKTWADSPNAEEYQDRINDYVWLTRGDRRMLYNTAPGLFKQSSSGGQGSGSPNGVEFALGKYSDGIDNLVFYPEISNNTGIHPINNLREDYVMKVVSNVINGNSTDPTYEYDYYSLKFTVWDQGSNRDGWRETDTSVSYERSKYPLNLNDDGYFYFSIPKGESEGTIIINTHFDLETEGVETYSFTLEGSSNVDLSQNEISFDVNDQTDVTITYSSQEVNEGESVTVTASIENAKTINTDINFTFTGDGISSRDYSLQLAENMSEELIAGEGKGDNLNFLNNPFNYALDKTGNIYINDRDNSRILKVTPGNLTATLIKGGSTGVDIKIVNDYLYVLEQHDVWRKYIGSDSSVDDREFTVAGGNGNGTDLHQLRADWRYGKLHVDQNENIYVLEHDNHRVVKWEPNATDGILIAGADQGQSGNKLNELNAPIDFHVTATGQVYVLDHRNYRVLKFTEGNKDGEIVLGTGIQGSGINQISNAYSIYVDEFETLYIVDESNHRVVKKEVGKSPIIVAGGNGYGSELNQLKNPTDFILDGNDGIYVYDREGRRIMLWEKGASQGIDVTGKIGVSSNSMAGPFRLDNDGNVLYLDRDNSKLWRINRTPKMRIDAGETSSQMTIEFRKDGIYENAETMTISPSSIRDTDIESADIIINDTDLVPEISIEASSLEIDENQENDITLTFNLNRESVLPISFDLTLSGTAEIESEYTISGTSVSIPAGETSASVTISTSGLDDDAIEVLETIIVTPTNIVNATTLSENFTLNLLSNDYPALTISPDSTEFNEGDVQEFTVALSEAHSKSTIVKIDFSGDMSPNDYVFTKELDEEFDFVTFSKTWEDSENDEAFQDRINDYVWLTRKSSGQGLFNISQGQFNQQYNYDRENISGVEFALGKFSDGIENLIFVDGLSRLNNQNHPKNNIGQDFVMKVVSNVITDDNNTPDDTTDDTQVYEYDYYSIKFLVWDQGSNRDGWNITDTSVTYTRSKFPLANSSGSLRIKAGEKSATYTLEFPSDLIYEGKESLVKAITITNSSTPDFSKTLVVDDFVEINTSISDTSTVEGENVTITASLNEVRSTETIVNFSLSGSADQSDIIAQNDLPNNGIETLFGVNGFDDNTITDMMLHKGEVYFSIARSGVFKINADNTYSKLINYVNNNPYIRAFTIDNQDNVYVIEEHTVYKYSASTNYSYNDRVAVTMPGNWGAGLNQLRDANSISIDDNGDMIIVDTNNHRIVKWEQGGSEGTLLFGDPNGGYGSGNSGLNSPTDLVFDGTYYYVLDSNNRKRIVVLDSDFKYVSSTINFNNSTAPEQYYIKSMFVKNDKIYVPLGLRDWNTTYDDKQGEIAVFNTYSESSPMVLQDLIEFKYTNELNEQVIPANSRGYFVIDDNGNYFLQGDGNKIYYKQYAPKIIIPASSLSSTVEISIVDDLSFEGPEQLVLNPSSPNNDIDDNLVLDIVDNDEAPKINITFSAPFIDENQEESVEVIFTPEVRSGLEISFDIDLSGTATEEEEFIVSTKSLIIPANSFGSITVSTKDLNDDNVEIAETITFSLSNLVNATFDSPATLELHSDDYPEATIISGTREFAEHETLKIEASLSAPHSKDTKITYNIDDENSIAKIYEDYFFASEAGNVRFIKPSWASDSDPEYQDRISETVWLTRGKQHGIYNAYDQTSQQRQQTSGIMLALGSIENLSELSFETISEWGRKFHNGEWLNKDLVLYLTETDEYYSFMMTSWDQGRQGGFSYTRSKGAIKPKIELIIPAGATKGSATVTGVEDELMDEGTEPFALKYGSIENGTISNTDNLSLSILDNTISMTLREDVFIGVQNGDFSWGDFDSDGDKDLALIGDAGETLISKVYENTKDENGNVVFQEIQVEFKGVGFGAVRWVDLNQDGKIDLFISGIDQNFEVESLVYINNSVEGTPSFELVNTYNFPDLVKTSLDFGDLDNDGDVDYAITGFDSGQNLRAYYGYQNLETKNFELKTANFEAFVNGEIRIVDIDADGDNDVIYTGGNDVTGPKGGVVYNSYVPNQNNNNNYWDSWWQNEQLRSKYGTLEIFKPQDSNAIGYMVMGQGSGYAVNSPLSVPQLKNGDIAAGDFNNNGIDDFLFTGETENGEGYTKLFEGKYRPVIDEATGNYSAYVESNFTFDQLINSSAEWVDYDNDGDLDLFLIGLKIGEGEKTYLYETEVVNKKNSKPETISGLKSELVGNGVVNLSWNKPTDDFTSSLGYNVRLGKSSGGTELSYTISNLETGDLLISRSPNNYNLFYQTQLEPGTYYWSVQAVDQGLKAGPYSEEQSFTIVYDWKILNQGGLFDKSISSGNNPMLKVVDLDNDEDLDLILKKDNEIKFYSYNDGILNQAVLQNFNNYYNNVKEIKFSDFMNQSDNSLFISADGRLNGYILGQVPNYEEYQDWRYNESSGENMQATVTHFPDQMRIFDFEDGTRQIECYQNDCSEIPEKTTNGIGVVSQKDIGSIDLYEEKYGIADFNNDGINEIFVIGVDSNDELFMDVKFYMFSYDKFSDSFERTDLTDQITDIGRIKGPAFDFGDYDNDQDIDIIISGDKIVGTSITKIFKNITLPGEKEISLEASNEIITGVSNGSTDFIDFDSDGDLDILLSGTNDTGVDVFELLLNDQSGEWPSVPTNLDPMKNTNVDLGDFNGDGYIDMLISGESSNGKLTKLLEYTPASGFIDSDFDVSDIVDARVEFGDLDGDEDLDFIIAGKSKQNENDNIFRTYLNYRNESYLVTNPPSFSDIDLFVKHENDNTQISMRDGISVAAILLEYENEVSIDYVLTRDALASFNEERLQLIVNKNKVILYGSVSQAISSQSFSTLLVHNPENLNGVTGNTLSRILSVAAIKDGKLKSITSDSEIYNPTIHDSNPFSSFQTDSFFNKERIISTDSDVEENQDYTNNKPDMPFLLDANVIEGELDKSNGKLFVELTWNSAVDDNTDLEGLTYAIKMGTTSGSENIVSSNSSINGVRKSAGKGNAEHNTKWKIALEPGTYYWSVQSIDNAQTGSEFSSENVFTVSNENLLYDLGDSNGDNVVNIADVINAVDFMLNYQLPRFIEYATDVNDDNLINVLDVMGIVDIILTPAIETNSFNVNGQTSRELSKKITSKSDLDYRSSDPVGDVELFWEGKTLYLSSDHSIGGLQFKMLNQNDIVLSDRLNMFQKTKLNDGEIVETLLYTFDAASIKGKIELFTIIGDIEHFDESSLIVSTEKGLKLTPNFITLSIDRLNQNSSFEIYPNPAFNDQVNININSQVPLNNQNVKIFDLLGRTLLNYNIAKDSFGNNKIQVDLKGIPNGVLFIEYNAENQGGEIKFTSEFINK